jgi:cobalt-precorrin-5B (C1)-methyltransferase
VIVKKKNTLRSGYTTGTCAAAAAKGAALALFTGQYPCSVTVDLPVGGVAEIPLFTIMTNKGAAQASVIKDAGDDPDVTHGIEVCAEVVTASEGIEIIGGTGVGVVTKPGLPIAVGKHAINPVPLGMITKELLKVLPANVGVKVIISVPQGEKVAKRTMNERLGIVGGISILGTGGIVRPMSEDAYRRSLVPQIDMALAQGFSNLILTPGRMGAKRALAMGVPDDCIVETSNFIGTLLEESVKRGVKGVIILGHLGKMVKLAGGIFHTHSRMADARKEIITAHAALYDAPPGLIKQLMTLNTAEQAVELLAAEDLMVVFNSLAEAAEQRCRWYCYGEMEIGTLLYSATGIVVGTSKTALKMGEEMGWHIPYQCWE